MTAAAKWIVILGLLSAACRDDGARPNAGPEREKENTSSRIGTVSAAVGTATAVEGTPISDPPYWPRFHGPDGYNKSSDTGLLREWPAGGPPLIWIAAGIGHGFSGVTLASGRIYTDGNIDDKTVITALDLAGQVTWRTPNGPAWAESHSGTRSTPTYDDGRIYHLSPSGEIICLDAQTGAVVWGFNILARFDGPSIEWGLAESLLLDGDRVICCPGGEKVSVAALDKRTGDTVWTARGTGHATSYASPTVIECQGLRMILTMTAKALIGVNADDGNLLFEFPKITKYDINVLLPLYHDGHIFISSGYGSGSALVKVTVTDRQASVEQVWESKEMDNHHGGVILMDGYVYGAASARNNAKWICLDWKTGEMKYAEKGVGKGSVTYADGMLYTLSENRKMGLVQPSPDGHRVVSQFTVPSGGDDPSWAHPVVCGGRLYIRHSDHLYAYDVRARQ